MVQHHQQHAPVHQPADHGFKAAMDKFVEMIKEKFNGLAKMFQGALGDLKGHHMQGHHVPDEQLSYLHSPPQHIMSNEKAQQNAIASSQTNSAGNRA